MANTRFEYVKKFEMNDSLMPSTYLVVRIDGRGFHKFTKEHNYDKPNDVRGINLMNFCAKECMNTYADCCLAFGESDEFSFILDPATKLFNRRKEKILTTFVSLFTSCFLFNWKTFFPDQELLYPPSFDGRIVLYPSFAILRDYLSWRQADTHINNLYNTCFWTLIEKGGLSGTQAEERLRGTTAGDKNEILFTEFQINYNELPEMFRKGSVLLKITSKNNNNGENNIDTNNNDHNSNIIEDNKEEKGDENKKQEKTKNNKKGKKEVEIMYVDIIGKSFWDTFKPVPVLR